jgi:hypothetical protein
LLISLASGPDDVLIQTMQHIHDILREWPGEDRVRLRIPHRQHGMIVMQPRTGVQCSVALIDQLQSLAAIAVESSR